MKKILQHTFLWLVLAISLFSFSGCGDLFIGIGQLIYIYTADHRETYLLQNGLTEEDVLPIEEIKVNESYRFNGEVYNIIDLNDTYETGFFYGFYGGSRYYEWRVAGTYLDGRGDNGSSKIVGLKEGKIGYYVGGMTPFVYVSTYDENWDMLSYHWRDFVKEGVEIPYITEVKFTGAVVTMGANDSYEVAFETLPTLGDIFDYQMMVTADDLSYLSCCLNLYIEDFPYLQSKDFNLYERNGEMYFKDYWGRYFLVKDEYQFFVKDMVLKVLEA